MGLPGWAWSVWVEDGSGSFGRGGDALLFLLVPSAFFLVVVDLVSLLVVVDSSRPLLMSSLLLQSFPSFAPLLLLLLLCGLVWLWQMVGDGAWFALGCASLWWQWCWLLLALGCFLRL